MACNLIADNLYSLQDLAVMSHVDCFPTLLVLCNLNATKCCGLIEWHPGEIFGRDDQHLCVWPDATATVHSCKQIEQNLNLTTDRLNWKTGEFLLRKFLNRFYQQIVQRQFALMFTSHCFQKSSECRSCRTRHTDSLLCSIPIVHECCVCI